MEGNEKEISRSNKKSMEREGFLDEWREGLLIPILKKGEKGKKNEYGIDRESGRNL